MLFSIFILISCKVLSTKDMANFCLQLISNNKKTYEEKINIQAT